MPVFVVLLGCSGNVPPPPSFALAEPKLDFQALAFRLLSRYAEHSSALSVRCGLVPALSVRCGLFRSSSGLLVLFRCAIFVPAVDETEILAPVPIVWRFSLFSVADVCRRFVAYALVSLACAGFRMFSLPLAIKTFRYSFLAKENLFWTLCCTTALF